MQASLPELEHIERLASAGGAHVRCEIACRVPYGRAHLPVYALTLGNPDPALPAARRLWWRHSADRMPGR